MGAANGTAQSTRPSGQGLRILAIVGQSPQAEACSAALTEWETQNSGIEIRWIRESRSIQQEHLCLPSGRMSKACEKSFDVVVSLDARTAPDDLLFHASDLLCLSPFPMSLPFGRVARAAISRGSPVFPVAVWWRQSSFRTPQAVEGGLYVTQSTSQSTECLAHGWQAIGLLRALEALIAGRTPELTPSIGRALVELSCGNGSQLTYGAFRARYLSRRVVEKSRGVRETWSVALLNTGWRGMTVGQGKPIPNPPGGFLADPFPVQIGGELFVLAEFYPWDVGKGHIVAMRSDGAGWSSPITVMDFDHHLSFPFVFRHEGELFMVPEQSESGTIRIYRNTGAITDWKEEGVLLHGLSAVDTILLPHGPSWFMLTNLKPRPGLDHRSEMAVFVADTPLSDDWRPLPGNPQVRDARGARNGGLVWEGGKPYRVAQVQGFLSYGESIRLQEIDLSTPGVYRERTVGTLRCEGGGPFTGIHHMASMDGHIAYDMKRPMPVRRRSG